ncbi:unnamed protein product [Cyprideis torosa]|uniref:Uncharacterized protein n=1 Tax=Cyprideis torosa TaxID=163714 RepID=A0A7R8WWL0_9CRUS|nr:unnamed protein product [Cyprideis torosa]CAG0908532.1 unnamed protein product [Cyprideis torosa]
MFVACGFNSIGIQSAGGAGMALAQWIDGGEPPFDLWDVDIRRMMPCQNTKRYLEERARESLGLLYADHFPYRQFASARGLRRSPLHDGLARQGACFGETAGWERANWFAPPGVEPKYEYSWQRQNWFDYSAAEHHAAREGVGLFDLSSFGKILVQGRDAQDVLQRLCANDIAVEPGRIVYTPWLNERGGIEADVTVARLGDDRFLVVTAGACVVRNLAWLQRHTPDDAHCFSLDVSVSEAVIAVMGPRSRELLQTLTPNDLGNEAFPFSTVQHIEIGMAPVRAHRISYVGELGWELYVSSDMAAYVHEQLVAAGDAVGLVHCGLHALDSLRIEKAFRHFGHDITDEDHVLEAGLGFTVKLDKPAGRFGDSFGFDAVRQKKADGLKRRLLQFRLRDPKPLLYHNEPIRRNGEIVGHLTSGNYGHWLGGAIGLGYVHSEPGQSAAALLDADWQIEVAGQRVATDASLKPLYDPSADKTRT